MLTINNISDKYSALLAFSKKHFNKIALIAYITAMACFLILLFYRLFFLHPNNEFIADHNFIFRFSYVMRFFIKAIPLSLLLLALTRKIPIHRMFLVTALSIGILYALLITPMSVPDESFHYFSSLRISNALTLNFEPTIRYNDADFAHLVGHHNVPSAYLRLTDPVFADPGDVILLTHSYSVAYPLQYAPQAVGLTLGRLFNLNFIWRYHLGTMFNLVFFVLCGFFAIKKMPFAKPMIFIIAMLPMTMHQAASFSSDGFINGLSLLLVACIFHSIYKKGPITSSEIAWIIATSTLLAPAKTVYFLLVFLALLIPKERFVSKKSHIITKSFMLGAGLFAILIFNLPHILSVAQSDGYNWEGGVNYTIGDLLRSPFNTLRIFRNTFVENLYFYVYSTFGRFLSGLNLHTPMWMSNVFIVLLGLSGLKNKSDDNENTFEFLLRKRHKFTMLIVSMSIIFLAMLSMLLGWTSNWRDVIQGVQGRYFIPILLPLFLLMQNKTLVLTKNIDKYLICTVFLLHSRVLNSILGQTIARLG